MVTELNGKLLEFNFRNGHLRRKYDSLKYSLRNLENILCELSFMNVNPTETSMQESKRPRIDLAEVAETAKGMTYLTSSFFDHSTVTFYVPVSFTFNLYRNHVALILYCQCHHHCSTSRILSASDCAWRSKIA